MFSHGSDNSSLSLNTESVRSLLQAIEGNSPLNPDSVLKFGNHSSSGLLDRAWQEVTTGLSQFASDPGFTSKINLAFGTDWSLTEAQSLFQGWAATNFSTLPKVEIRSDLDSIGANGAFAGETRTIYLSSNFLAQNADNPNAVASVWLEEIGHEIDFRINKTDAAGDEGDIFSRLVRGVAITVNELGLLQMENDATTVVWDGKSLRIEQSSTLEVARNIDGRLEEFTIEKGTNNVSFRWQLLPNSAWSNWTTMRLNGSELKGKELEVVENKDGRLELFVIGLDNKVWQTWQTVPSGLLGWSKPVEFGLQATEIEVSRNKDGRLEAFAIDMRGELKQKWQTKVNSSWTGWNNFGLKASEIDVVQNQDGRLEIFGIGTDGEVWKKWQYQPNGVSGWSGWDKLGLKAKDIEVVRNKDGHLEAFAIGTDGEVWQKWQTKVNGGWTGWNNFGLKASEIEVTQNQDGRLEIFGIRTDGEVFQRWQQKPNGVGGWSNWTQFGLKAVEIEAARNADGRLELFAVDAVGKVEQRWQLKVNGTTGWSSWNEQSGIKGLGENQLIQLIGSGQNIIDAVNRIDPNKNYKADVNYTYCNWFAADILEILVGEGSLKYNDQTYKSPVLGIQPKPVSANDLNIWFKKSGGGKWKAVSAEEAVSLANNGKAVVASSPSPGLGISGHIAIVIPGGSGSNVRIAQAGRINGKDMSLQTGFGDSTKSASFFTYIG